MWLNLLPRNASHAESPIPRIRKKKKFTLGNSTKVWVSSLAPDPPRSCSFAISTVAKSALLRGLSIPFLSLIGSWTVPEFPQFGIRRTSWSQYRFSFSRKGPHNGSLKIQSSLRALSLPLYPSLSKHVSPNYPSVVSCSSAAPVGLCPFDLLPNGRQCLGAHCKFSDALSSPNRGKTKAQCYGIPFLTARTA
ncbi:hypothetical protein TNCV_4775891 [Trichonephila clavipes]|nr:hypothetical protein TNCV_4775891 [Trichonephila clavipes]